MEIIQYCPGCLSNEVYVADRWFYVKCGTCKMTGPYGKTEEEAVELWNNLPRERVERGILTLEGCLTMLGAVVAVYGLIYLVYLLIWN